MNTEEICVQPKQTVGKWNGEGDWSSWCWWFCFGAWCQGQKHKKTHFSKWGCLRRMLLLHTYPPSFFYFWLADVVMDRINRFRFWQVPLHSGPENLKKSSPKNSWNQINQFHENFFGPNSSFCNFKNGQKSIFELGKADKNAISQKEIIDLFVFMSFFAWTFLKF